MDSNLDEEQQLQTAILTRISFTISNETDRERTCAVPIDAVSEVTDPRLGLPNWSSVCSTCGATDLKHCEGHFGAIKFPFTIIHPYYMSEVAQILNKVCPGCKSIRKKLHFKGAESISQENWLTACRYCMGNSKDWYPKMKFKFSSQDPLKRTSIIVEVNEKFPKKGLKKVLPADYWDFIPEDAQQGEICLKPNRRVLTHAQVRYLLNGVDPKFIKQFVSRIETLFLNFFPITPNCHRVTQVMHGFSNGQRLVFDERTRAYRKLVDFRGMASELSFRLLDCLKISKLNAGKSLNNDSVAVVLRKNKDPASDPYGQRWVKDVVLAKRNDHSFRMVVIGDINIKPNEVGIPRHIAERLQIPEHLNALNWEQLCAYCELCCHDKGTFFVRRKDSLIRCHNIKDLQIGDIVYRPLSDGDIVLINRPPSIHHHSMLALSVKVLPVTSVICINPLCCSPLRGDFDGDCLHGYVPQSIETRVELSELVALDRQLINRQSGRNLLSLGHDSLTAAHLVLEYWTLLDLFQMQQLKMFCPHQLLPPAIIEAPSLNGFGWTGKQLFSMLLPREFNYASPSNSVCICNGELISSEGSTWLRETDSNFFQSLIKSFPGNVLDFLCAAQETLCEWLSTRGLSISLSDLYLTSDSSSRKNLMDEIFSGLQEAEQTCNFKQLMVDSNRGLLAECLEEDEYVMGFDAEYLSYERQRSASLNQVSVNAFKQVFWDINNLFYKYASKDNSMLAICKAGSKGNLHKLVQNSMCLGLQYSTVPLSFEFPHQLSCAGWNKQKGISLIQKAHKSAACPKSYIPYAVVHNSFLTGLNPIESFVHSVTSRGSSFSDNADLPGTLSRRLMYFMRDLHAAYDGTVRNAYGNQLVQFSYNADEDIFSSISNDCGRISACKVMDGEPVGSLAACAISEAAYSALDQPVSLLETSPLLNLKNVLECGSKKNKRHQSMSLFLSEKLGRQRHGFEYGALEVKNRLEKLIFSDVVSTSMIIFSPQSCGKMHFSPWVCHFHLCKEIVKSRRLKVHSIIDLLHKKCNSVPNFPILKISSKDCSVAHDEKEDNDTFCITVTVVENTKNSSIQLDTIRDLVMPFLLGTVVKGVLEVKKVDILWKDRPKVPKSNSPSSGGLYLRVLMEGNCSKTRLWSVLLNGCLQITDMIDWTRSHPDNIYDFCLANGIDAGWKFFLTNLECTIADIGKTILSEHLVLVTNCLSTTGEFVSLNAKGLAQQREHASVSSPFVKACFSTPGQCFIKAAKAGAIDNLQGSLDALAWGKVPPIGTGGQFDIMYSGKGCELSEPLDVYDLLGSLNSSDKLNVNFQKPDAWKYTAECRVKSFNLPHSAVKGFDELMLKSHYSQEDIQNLSRTLSKILRSYSINQQINETDKSVIMEALSFHPRKDDKLSNGVQAIKVGHHPKYENSRCFMLERADGTLEDFSYRKCILGAYEIIAPQRAKGYKSMWLKDDKVSSDSFKHKYKPDPEVLACTEDISRPEDIISDFCIS
ncbi:DNA-directed RNA polymerase IV subunit 1 [Tripterygium wilfordii]|uniref:DNA-directed RNA polymerase n=1 Tax=Tripterygium wilfordii TaxID=458696 RepID=A0A7J7CLA6_TRIWF|nr:DNA-directed RNA polymerase IV subunit 1-like [Tripterygium wilfordii]KAF5734840.1 DNA-directed RNA polymerase IV subunit 1 [Tripterygium wilfordii]